jgi:hypothetical protein
LIVVQTFLARSVFGVIAKASNLDGALGFGAVDAEVANGTPYAFVMMLMAARGRNLRPLFLFRQSDPFRYMLGPLLHRQFGPVQVLRLSH